MPTTELPQSKQKAHEIAQKITNERPSKRDKDTPEGNVTGGFNQKSRPSPVDGTAPDEGKDESDFGLMAGRLMAGRDAENATTL